MAKKAAKVKKIPFMLMMAVAAFLLLTFYLLNSNNFNINTGASRSKYTASGTLVRSGSNLCNTAYSYGLLDPSGKECTSLVISSSTADPYIDQKVKVTGGLKDGIFYVTSVYALGGGDTVTVPTITPLPYPKVTPTAFPRMSDPCLNNMDGTYRDSSGIELPCRI